jgi:hypothetical protein
MYLDAGKRHGRGDNPVIVFIGSIDCREEVVMRLVAARVVL